MHNKNLEDFGCWEGSGAEFSKGLRHGAYPPIRRDLYNIIGCQLTDKLGFVR